MLMIIFGAGASHDSYAPSPPPPGVKPTSPARNRPPLTDGLFNEATWGEEIKLHQGCLALFPRLRGASSVEEELESFMWEAHRLPHIAGAMLELRGYLRDVIVDSSRAWHAITSGATNYVELLEQIEKWRCDNRETVCVVTFNYDTLLEDACRDVVRLEFRDMPSYVAYSSYKLFKLHGSVNWYRLVSNVPGPFSASLPGLQWTDTYTLDTRTPPPGPTEDYVPAIAVPTIAKSSFECLPSHLEALQSALPNVTHLLVIGWRGMEEQFLRLWAEAGATAVQRIRIVSGSSEDAFTLWARLNQLGILPKGSSEKSNLLAGFSKFLTEGGLARFLSH